VKTKDRRGDVTGAGVSEIGINANCSS
jgi:hypothetical protein